MWDSWNGVKFYPRPYDMDTQMGLSNTGTETINPDAEIIPEISPFKADGTFSGYYNNDTITANRYLSYNTKTSKLWNTFAKEFDSEIKSAYHQLRSSGVYSVDSIIKSTSSHTIDKIGEIYYNKDMATKYLSQVEVTGTEFLKTLHGNRIQRYKQFLKERLTFCDTLFEYMESEDQTDTTNSIITLRSDAFYGNNNTGGEDSTLKCYLGISVYTPQYVMISVGSGRDAIVTAYVSPNSTYEDPDTGATMEGTLFSFPIKATDKEMIITGAGNIKNINKLEDLNVRDLTIAKAKKLLKLNLTGSSRMTTLALGNNSYLKELNVSNSYLLGTGIGGQLLNLKQCTSLKKLNVAYTKLTAINFPANGNLSEIILDGSTIKSISLDNMEFLTNVSIANCTEIVNYTINNCPKMVEVDISDSTVRAFVATNCTELTRVNVSNCKAMESFDATGSDKIEVLNMQGNGGSIMNDLKLYTLYNLKSLNVSNSISLKNIRFPKYKSPLSTELWDKLETFIISDSTLTSIQYGSADVSEPVLDMKQLTNLKSLSFRNCTSIKKIVNINYSNPNLSGLFQNCLNLLSVQGTLTCTSNINNLFYTCHRLNDIKNLTMNFTGVTTASSALYRCFNLDTSDLKQILDACGSSLTNINSIVSMWSYQTQYTEGYTTHKMGTVRDSVGRTIPSNLFENTPNLTTISGAFTYTGYTDIPGTLLNGLNSIRDVSGTFSMMSSLVTVGSDLLKNKPSITTVARCFGHDNNLENYINGNANIFEGSPNIESIQEIFLRNTKLKVSSLENMLTPLVKLKNASYVFFACKAITCGIPEGFFSKNINLQTIEGFFAESSVRTIPERLFRVNVTDTNNLTMLTNARSVFSRCTNLTGTVGSNFFLGASAINNLGYSSTITEYNTANYYTLYGFFADTQIDGYNELFLFQLTNLTDCNGLFRKTSASTTLKYCYYYDDSGQENEYMNTISPNLFYRNTKLQNANYIFANNSSVKGCIPEDLFKYCKGSLRNVQYAFLNCIGLTGVNLDATGDESNLVGITDKWFSNAMNLGNIGGFIKGCSNFNGVIPSTLLSGCRSLTNASEVFMGCSMINGNVPVELFNDCRATLQYTYGMFNGCVELEGIIGTGTYTEQQGLTGYIQCLPSDDGALQVVANVTNINTQVAYNTVIGLSPALSLQITDNGSFYVKPVIGIIIVPTQLGLLSNCLKLINASNMFYNCQKLGVGTSIPFDMFYTDTLSKRYNELVDIQGMFYRCAFNKPYIDENSNIAYLCNEDFLTKCVALKYINNVFSCLKSMPSCNLYQTMFNRQSNVENADRLFYGTTNLTGAVTGTLLANSLGKLERASKMFGFTNMTSVTTDFLHGEVKNTKLKYINNIFYNCTNITGASPVFWDGNVFTALQYNSDGYFGALYNCTKLSNYQMAQNNSSGWINNQGLVAW